MEPQAEYSTDDTQPPAHPQRPHLYLMDEHVHSFYPTLAAKIGLNEAIVIQQIHSWIITYTKDPNRFLEQHWHDGRWWIWNSYPDWHEKLPYLSESTIIRTLGNLRETGLVLTGNYNALKIDRTLWYTIDYAAYDSLWADQEAKTTSPSSQNDEMDNVKMTSPLPSSSASFSVSREGATAQHAPRFDELPIPAETRANDNIDVEVPEYELEDDLFFSDGPPKQTSSLKTSLPKTTDPLALAAHCQKAREAETLQTVPKTPAHRGKASPAVLEFKRATGYMPPPPWRDEITSAVGEDPDRLKRWYETCFAYVGNGWNPRNAKGMLDYFVVGTVPDTRPADNGRHDTHAGGNAEPPSFEYVEPEWMGVTA